MRTAWRKFKLLIGKLELPHLNLADRVRIGSTSVPHAFLDQLGSEMKSVKLKSHCRTFQALLVSRFVKEVLCFCGVRK
jgi:hypothetical protein